MPTVKVLIGQCSYKGPDKHCYNSHWQMMHYLGRIQEASSAWWEYQAPPDITLGLKEGDPVFKFFTNTVPGCSLIGMARDIICEDAVNQEMDYVFFYDDDMILPRDAFLRLWRHQEWVCAALAFQSREPYEPVIYRFKKDWDGKKQTEMVDIESVTDYKRGSLIEVQAAGTGCVLIDTRVFKRIPRPWFHGGLNVGEDILFSWRCHKYKIPVHVDTSVKTLHKINEAQWMGEEKWDEINHRDTDVS